jgi:hypothetical protein
MSTQIERRWGILAIAVLMFFVTMVVTSINGAKTSFYYYIWMMVGYYAYKANLSSIQSMMKIVIFINIGVLALIILFMDDTALGYLNSSSKLDLIASVIVMLIPKVGLYFYCKSQLERSYSFSKSGNLVAEEGLTEQSDDHWERAYNEVNGGERVTAIWARAFSEADGDESKAKALYLKYRINQLESKVGEKVTDKVSPVISINHVELKETAQKTVYQMFNDENNIYISDQKQSKKSDRGTWVFFICLIFLILFLIKDHRLL